MLINMRILKKINHNVVLIDDDGIEKIAMGRGIGFSSEVGGNFDPKNADKFFTLDSKEKTKMFSEMAEQIPIEYIEFSERMIRYISSKISMPLDSNIYISLTDHIYFAIQRRKEDKDVNAIMLPEMKLLYPDEYNVAKQVVNIINDTYSTELGDNEYGFITLHIVNAELGERNSVRSLRILEMTTDVLNLIEKNYFGHLDKDSLTYSRLMIHIKFLVRRLIYGEKTTTGNISFLNDSFKQSQPYKVSKMITEYIKMKYHLDVDDNETIYLAIHLARINFNKA